MRILVLAGDLDRPEVAIFQGLAERGVQVHVIGAISLEAGKALERSGIAVTQFEFRSRFDVFGMRLVRSKVRSERSDIIYALSNRALSTAVIGLCGIKIPIVAYRGTVGHISRVDPSSWFTYLNPKVKKILCVSNAVEKYLEGVGIPRARLTTVYKGHDPRWYCAVAVDRSTLGIPTDAFVVGCTAVMRAVKGIDDLLDAASILLSEIPSLHLVLVGPIRDPHIQRKTQEFPCTERLHLLGYRDDATQLATLYDITVMASKSREGFPKSVIEAMAQGIPAVVTAVGGMPELVDNGNAGVMAKPCDPASLADGIRKLYRDADLRGALGRAARERIATTFHVSKTIERTYAEFSQLIGACEIDAKVESPTRASLHSQTIASQKDLQQ